jgi:predicted negative regulator of RcsB-dependent stress response
MARERFRRKDLKRPDAFVTTSEQLITWALEHQRNLAIAGGAIAVVLALIAGAGALNAARTRQANEELASALGPFLTEQYAEAATQLRTVADSWASTDVGRIARLYAADAQLAAGNTEQAANDLQAALADPPPADYLTQQAALNLGTALESKGDLAAAADQYAKAAGMEGPYRGLALLRQGRACEKLGDKKRAVEAYEAFVRDFPEAPEADIAEARLALL